ncbi:hypothetical protein NEUTE1DRAFT_116872 [Neurospora tetrasperma FGSC 2508]|uniref:Uncharacterized protein n=1 Tax=Neurospora tetrasperma (strain FGSC 2508 / ATCC MYA-4615 / P0657) TaxID=510951 RepID=F8MLG3_NEUT8|nr:uncharacterized protein NEUTE1DRAFT_116872 [Neurospora tetrasperma FGSC 2508]EGO57585.1 hypothetical protein NEUTE1DRAFT_116872 [Neurospora tetrasperma FGSC 2508]EGZ72150.1 hypothetical protein NEUTE2DRAFT_144735 [Neurospora tetrasperma FGSC 2509]
MLSFPFELHSFFFSYTIPTYYNMAAGRCKDGGDRNWEYFNDVMDESEPINMMMGGRTRRKLIETGRAGYGGTRKGERYAVVEGEEEESDSD